MSSVIFHSQSLPAEFTSAFFTRTFSQFSFSQIRINTNPKLHCFSRSS